MSTQKKNEGDSKQEKALVHTRVASVRSSSFKEDNGHKTVQMVFATDTPAYRSTWYDGDYYEILDITKEAINTERLIGAPFLLDHRSWEVKNQIGVIEEFEINQETKEAICTVRFSKNRGEDIQAIISDIIDGIYRNVSVGYYVEEYEKAPKADGEKIPTYTATRWTPMEVSLVTIPADNNAKIRGEGNTPPTPELKEKTENNNMSKETEKTEAPKDAQNGNDSTELLAAERKRTSEILQLARKFDKIELGNTYIDEGKTPDQFRTAILEQLGAKNPEIDPIQTSTVKKDRAHDSKHKGIENALLLRSGFLDESKLSKDELQQLQQFRHYSMLDVVRNELSERGIKTLGESSMALAHRYLLMMRNAGISTSTDDFPLIFDNLIKRVVIDAYTYEQPVWKDFAKIGNVSDFKKHRRVTRGFLSNLKRVNETGEYQNLRMGEGKEKDIAAETYGGIVDFSRQMIINDDLGLLIEVGQAAADSTRWTIEDLVFEELLDNSTNFFSAQNRNLITLPAGTPGVLTPELLIQAKQLLNSRTETDSAGTTRRFKNPPKTMLIDTLNESIAEDLNDNSFEIDPAGNYTRKSRVNGLVARIVSSPLLDGTNKLFIFGANPRAAAIEVAFLNNQQNPYLERQETFEQDGVRYKVRIDVGVKKMDENGAVMIDLTETPAPTPPAVMIDLTETPAPTPPVDN